MRTIGLRQLRQDASQVVRRVQEDGESLTVTVQGRPAALLGPITPSHRQRNIRGSVVNERLRDMPVDETGWAEEAYRLREGDPLMDPWERNASS